MFKLKTLFNKPFSKHQINKVIKHKIFSIALMVKKLLIAHHLVKISKKKSDYF